MFMFVNVLYVVSATRNHCAVDTHADTATTDVLQLQFLARSYFSLGGGV